MSNFCLSCTALAVFVPSKGSAMLNTQINKKLLKWEHQSFYEAELYETVNIWQFLTYKIAIAMVQPTIL